MEEQWKELQGYLDKAASYQAALALFGWDAETLAPPESHELTARVVGVLAEEYFALMTGERVRELAASIDGEALGTKERAILRRLRRELDSLEKLPQKEYGAYQELLARSPSEWKKAKEKLRRITSRSRCGSIVQTMEKIKVYMRGWLNYYGIADMKNNIESLNGWLYRRIRMCIWKQWKQPRTRMRKLIGLGVDSHYAATIAYDRKGYWFNAGNKAVNWALSKERLINWGFYDIATAYQSLHVNY